MSCPAARTSDAVGGAVDPYILMSGRPSVDPMSPMPAGEVEDEVMTGFDAMPAGPSGPAQPGVITAVLAAMANTGTASRVAAVATPPPRRVGRSTSDGLHNSAAHPVINANSRTQLMTSKAPTG